MIAEVIVIDDEGLNLGFEIAPQVIVFEQDAVLKCQRSILPWVHSRENANSRIASSKKSITGPDGVCVRRYYSAVGNIGDTWRHEE